MRQGKLSIRGRDYPLCFSTRVVCDVADRYGDMEGMYNALSDDNLSASLGATMWILAEMSKAGERYARLLGEDPPPALTEEELYDSFGVDDLQTLYMAIMNVVTDGTRRDVEAEPPKNGEATQPAR